MLVNTLFRSLVVLAVIPTSDAQPSSDILKMTADAAALREAFDRLRENPVLSPTRAMDPTILEPFAVSRWDWAVMQAKVDLLTTTFSLGTSCKPAWNMAWDPGLDDVVLEDSAGGYLYWPFLCKEGTDDATIGWLALHVFGVLKLRIMHAHISTHCLVVDIGAKKGTERRYVVIDNDDNGNLLPPYISITHPRPSVARRDQLERMFRDRHKLRNEYSNSCPQARFASERHKEQPEYSNLCERLEARIEELSTRLDGIHGFGKLHGRAIVRMISQPQVPDPTDRSE